VDGCDGDVMVVYWQKGLLKCKPYGF